MGRQIVYVVQSRCAKLTRIHMSYCFLANATSLLLQHQKESVCEQSMTLHLPAERDDCWFWLGDLNLYWIVKNAQRLL